MIAIYSILLYLQQLICGSVYTQVEMDTILSTNQQSIQQIQADALLMEQITLQYEDEAEIIQTTNSEIKF